MQITHNSYLCQNSNYLRQEKFHWDQHPSALMYAYCYGLHMFALLRSPPCGGPIAESSVSMHIDAC
jgi:hypothetical protein